MKSLGQLEQDALHMRHQFNRTLIEVNQRTTLPRLANEALELLTVRPSSSPIKSIVAAGAIWLIQRVLGQSRQRSYRKPKNRTLK
jgi:hypothetical protein